MNVAAFLALYGGLSSFLKMDKEKRENKKKSEERDISVSPNSK